VLAWQVYEKQEEIQEESVARAGSAYLDTNDAFPQLELRLVSGEKLTLPEGIGAGYSVVLFYRGHWWPFCNQQLADFQGLDQEFKSEQINVIAASVDPIEKAREMIDKHGITFPVGYGLVAEEVSRMTGAYYEKERKHLHATGFLLRPEKTIVVACYSTGQIGRLVAKDVLRVVKFYKSRGPAWKELKASPMST
jgi:peroxiredoxin